MSPGHAEERHHLTGQPLHPGRCPETSQDTPPDLGQESPLFMQVWELRVHPALHVFAAHRGDYGAVTTFIQAEVESDRV